MSTILVTGGSGFLGGHCIVAALKAGHQVRTTVRSLEKAPRVRTMIEDGGAEAGSALTFHAADLREDAGWVEAVAGCDYVLHVASPFPAVQPTDPEELIAPARDGALRVLRAARDAGVKRVVLTSSFAAIGYGDEPQSHVYTEDDWTPTDAPNPPYVRSKTIAERVSWDFAGEKGAPELTVVNPTGIFGPLLGSEVSTSVSLIEGLMDGVFSELPEMWFGVVDVRDVADLHLRAMLDPAAAGERFIAVAGEPVSLADVSAMLRKAFGALAARVPSEAQQPSPAVKRRVSSSAKAKQMLGWSPRSSEEAIIACAGSLLRQKSVNAGK